MILVQSCEKILTPPPIISFSENGLELNGDPVEEPLKFESILEIFGSPTRKDSRSRNSETTRHVYDDLGFSVYELNEEIVALRVEFSRIPDDRAPQKRSLRDVVVSGKTISRTTSLQQLRKLGFKTNRKRNFHTLRCNEAKFTVSMNSSNTRLKSLFLFIGKGLEL